LDDSHLVQFEWNLFTAEEFYGRAAVLVVHVFAGCWFSLNVQQKGHQLAKLQPRPVNAGNHKG
jgi:hypothetical protein